RHTHPHLLFLTPPPPPHTHPLSLHDALPISATPPATAIESTMKKYSSGKAAANGSKLVWPRNHWRNEPYLSNRKIEAKPPGMARDRKSTRLNSSHVAISYAVFCLKKKKKKKK